LQVVQLATSSRIGRLDFSRAGSRILFNPGEIMIGEVGLRALAATVDLLLIRLIENLRIWTDFLGIENLNLETVRFLFHL